MSWLDPECPACGLKHTEHKPRRPTVCIEALRDELQRVRYQLFAAKHSRQRLRDLEIVVADQRRHIANLEEELLPHLVAPSEQEAMQL